MNLFLETSYDEHDFFRIVEVSSDFAATTMCHIANDVDTQLILCSQEKTFSVRKVEFSNSLLVTRKRRRDDGTTILERQSRMFEVSTCNPRSIEALNVLRMNFCTLTDIESNSVNTSGMLLSSLVTLSSCSFSELRVELLRSGAIICSGRVRLLHPSVINQVVDTVFLYLGTSQIQIDQKSMIVNWKEVEKHCVPSMFPQVVLDAVRAILCDGHFERCEFASLSLERCLKFAAAYALESMSEPSTTFLGDAAHPLCWVGFSDFYEKWKSHIPQTVLDTLDHEMLLDVLRGNVLFDPTESISPQKIAWCESFSLPRKLEERVRQLFSLSGNGKWSSRDLRPFVDPILDFGHSFETSIGKVCKDHRVPGKPVVYSLHA